MTRRVVALGDVGAGAVLHAGDEAMLATAFSEVGQRLDVEWTVISKDPHETAQRYGVSSVAGLGFDACPNETARAERLQRLIAATSDDAALSADDPSRPALRAIAAADAVLIAGGGNLSADWPTQVYERAAISAIAAALAVPVVASGQGLGPRFTERMGQLASSALTGARFVGVRDAGSAVARRAAGRAARPDLVRA